MKKKLLLLSICLIMINILVACNGVANMEVSVYDKNGQLMNDVYIGLYTANGAKRIDFAYTLKGVATFETLPEGTYRLEVVAKNFKKSLKVQLSSGETNYIKVRE